MYGSVCGLLACTNVLLTEVIRRNFISEKDDLHLTQLDYAGEDYNTQQCLKQLLKE